MHFMKYKGPLVKPEGEKNGIGANIGRYYWFRDSVSPLCGI